MIYERTMMTCFLRQLEYNNNNHLQEDQKQTIMNVHRKNAVKPYYFCFLVSITAKKSKTTPQKCPFANSTLLH